MIGNNFGILPVAIETSRAVGGGGGEVGKKRKSLVGIGDEIAVVSPDVLRPLEKRQTKGERGMAGVGAPL